MQNKSVAIILAHSVYYTEGEKADLFFYFVGIAICKRIKENPGKNLGTARKSSGIPSNPSQKFESSRTRMKLNANYESAKKNQFFPLLHSYMA